jgi:SAM-dependent methyltransferase
VPDYREDLAWIHHTGFKEFSESVAPWLASILPPGGFIVELGCGSGILAHELTRSGFQVLGIDASPSMIELARETAPDARFEIGLFGDVSIPQCDAILAVGEVLNYGRITDVARFFHRAAASTSLVVFDIAERDSYPQHDEVRVGCEDWSVIAIKDSDGVHLTRRVLTFREIDGQTRRSEEVHRLELYESAEIFSLLRAEGFGARRRRSYGEYRLPAGHAVYVAQRGG